MTYNEVTSCLILVSDAAPVFLTFFCTFCLSSGPGDEPVQDRARQPTQQGLAGIVVAGGGKILRCGVDLLQRLEVREVEARLLLDVPKPRPHERIGDPAVEFPAQVLAQHGLHAEGVLAGERGNL